ncbi:MAG: carboxypeptidase regulatory-like domain-containing protein, partial [Stenotrophobium sp.]
VLDGLSNKPVAGAAVSVTGASLTATSGANGQFTIANIPTQSFQLQIAASGYTTQTFSAAASAYGTVSASFLLPPQNSQGNTTTLQGQVTDASTHSAISGVTLAVQSSSITAQTDANGHYTLSNLPSLKFDLQITALNYASQTLNINLTAQGNYNLDVALNPANQTSTFQVLALSTNDGGKGANQVQMFQAQVGNQSTTSQEGILVGYILDSSGKQVAKVSPYAPGTQTTQSDFTFAAQEVKTLQIPWNPVQLPPGAYTLQLDVVKPGTITRDLPTGTVLASGSSFTSVAQTTAFIGTLAFDPPLSQAGSTTPVNLQALIVNAGNVPLSATPLTLTITDPSNATVLYTAPANTPLLAVGAFEYVNFGQWTPTTNGNLNVTITPQSAGVQGQVTGTLYVGDKPQGAFTVNPATVFTGNQTVQGTINVTGVDTTIGVSSPLVYAIRNAVQKGSHYVATNVVQDQNASHCLRCHVQSQSYYGLASLLGHDVGSDPTTTQFVYNAIATSQQSDGSLHSAYPGYAETQTALEMWALSQTQDKLSSFATKYKAAQFMQTRVSTSGNQNYWQPDYGSGWWASVDGHNMLTVTGLADLLLTAKNNSVANVMDYGSGNATSLSGAPNGLKLGPDGALYAMTYDAGTILRFDPSSGTVATVYSGLPAHCSSALPLSAAEFYVTCPGGLIHVAPDGTQHTVVTLGNFPGDVIQGPDGAIYVTDTANNQILRGLPGGAYSTLVSGGLLNSPIGLAMSSDGSLYVANYNGFNILKIGSGATATVFADALSFRPDFLVLQPDGSLFVSHIQYNEPISGQETPDGLLQISNQGVARRVLSLPGLRGLATVGNQLYMVSYSSNNLYPLVTKPLDTSQLATFSATISDVVNYTLTEYNSRPDIFQLIMLGEARKVVTDQALLTQIDQAMTALDKVMRSRQNSDGGWGWSYQGQPSDALATALAGLGLEYLSPPVNDPVLLKAVQVLLNTQAADGSWSSADGVMSTRFATTGLVMAFLPRVLDQIGGLNVELHLNFPPNITLANSSLPPSGDLPTADGGSAYTFSLPGVT